MRVSLRPRVNLGMRISAQTQPYTVDELGAAMQEAGFTEVVMQPFLPDLTFLVSGSKP